MNDAIAEVQKAVDNEPQRRDLRIFLANLDMRAEQLRRRASASTRACFERTEIADLLFRSPRPNAAKAT